MHAPLLFCRHVRPNWGLSSSWMRIQVSENATRKTRGCYALRSLVWQSPCVKSCASPSDDATAGRCALGTTSRTFDVFLQTRPSDVVCSRQAQRVCLLFAISRRSWATEARQRYPLVPLHVFGERSPPASLLAASSKPHGRHNTLKNVQYLARCSSNSLGHASFYVSCRFEQTRTLVLVRMALRSVYDGCAHRREREEPPPPKKLPVYRLLRQRSNPRQYDISGATAVLRALSLLIFSAAERWVSQGVFAFGEVSVAGGGGTPRRTCDQSTWVSFPKKDLAP